jgi:hypothetical protein
MNKETIVVAFSGGRTSAFMCWWLIIYMSHLYNFIFVYANTGLEHEKTLEFVDKVDKYLKLNLIWVEADILNGDNATYRIVNYKIACRDNRLFKDMCKIYGLPNKNFPHCTRELKNRPIRKYAVDKIGYDYRLALGIRHDEMKKRLKVREDAIYPLATISKFTKQQILDWWKEQPFDLEIPEHLGNCKACFKKSDNKLQKVANEMPEALDEIIELEKEFSYLKSKTESEPRKMFRHFRTAYEVKHNFRFPSIDFYEDYLQNLRPLHFYEMNKLNLEHIPTVLEDECAEECGSIISDYESIKIIAEEKTLFDFIGVQND